MNGREYITASEIGTYVFCKRGWKLQQENLQSTDTGDTAQEEMNKQGISKQIRIRTLAAWLYITSGAAIMLYIILFS